MNFENSPSLVLSMSIFLVFTGNACKRFINACIGLPSYSIRSHIFSRMISWLFSFAACMILVNGLQRAENITSAIGPGSFFLFVVLLPLIIRPTHSASDMDQLQTLRDRVCIFRIATATIAILSYVTRLITGGPVDMSDWIYFMPVIAVAIDFWFIERFERKKWTKVNVEITGRSPITRPVSPDLLSD